MFYSDDIIARRRRLSDPIFYIYSLFLRLYRNIKTHNIINEKKIPPSFKLIEALVV